MQEPVRLYLEGDTLVLSGALAQGGVAALDKAVGGLVLPAGVVVVELDLFELVDAAAVAAMVNLIRRLALQRRLTLRHAPQLLAHNLYRIGALGPASAITLVAPRDEEPYG